MQHFRRFPSAKPNAPTKTIENQSHHAIECVSAATVRLAGAHEAK
jgi:hypothetical protein